MKIKIVNYIIERYLKKMVKCFTQLNNCLFNRKFLGPVLYKIFKYHQETLNPLAKVYL